MRHPTTRQTREQRAETLYAIYEAMGVNRTLEAVWSIVRTGGATLTLKTIERYSHDYGWVARVKEQDAQDTQQERQAVNIIGAMNDRHTALARKVMEIARKALDEAGDEYLSPLDAARMIDLAIKAERLALGPAMTRSEIALGIYNELIPALVDLFKQINVLEDPEERWRKFAVAADSLVEAYVTGWPLESQRVVDSQRRALEERRDWREP
jgi:hypothetical protein